MRIEPPRVSAAARMLSRKGLPPQLAFLCSFGIAEPPLAAAVARARADGVSPICALVAAGEVSEMRYYLCLASHLGLPFVADWPCLEQPYDIAAALACGRVALAGDPRGRWLLAPAAADVELLLLGRACGVVPAATAITAPAHLRQVLRHRAQATIAHVASRALPEARPRQSALGALSPRVTGAICLVLLAIIVGAAGAWHHQAVVLGLVFLAGLAFRLLVCAEGLVAGALSDDATIGDAPVADAALPTYAVLVPLKDEAGMVPGLVQALDRLDYPRAKRQVLLLVEADDKATRAALARPLPAGFVVVEVPSGLPRTKPRALNAGLLLTRATLITVYDAEDRPDPDQLRRAAARFARAPACLACLQARLVIDFGDSLLSRLFAIEYAVLFSLFNRGLARLRLPLALGGTSNHFRADALRAVGGWDAWNVTEDADLGLRLARFGYTCDMLDSVTLEEAPTRVDIWFKQRRRWMKGWLQTLVVLMRDLPAVVRALGPLRTCVVAMLLTNLVTGPLLTPIFLFFLVVDLLRFGVPSPAGPMELAGATLAYAVIALGAAGSFWAGFVAARSRGISDWRSLAVFLPYQLMIAFAAWGGLIDLVLRPYHWHKTTHGEAGRAAARRRWIR